MKCSRTDCPCPTPESWKEYRCPLRYQHQLSSEGPEDDRWEVDLEWYHLHEEEDFVSPFNDG